MPQDKKMASSQVEIAQSLPFDCVLRNHSPHDACATHASFKENINTFVRDNLNSRNIPISIDSAPSQSTQKPINNIADNSNTWVSRVAKNNLGTLSFTRRNHSTSKDNDKDDSPLSTPVSPRHSRIIDRWATARQAVSTTLLGNQANKVLEDFPSRSSSVSPSFAVGGSSESEISNLGASSLVQIWEKRLKPNALSSPAGRSSPNASCNENASAQVTISTPRIRGRHAFNDLLMQLEKDQYRELNNLAQRVAVSKFTHRGRIQSLLRLRLLQREVAASGQSCHESGASKVNSQPQGSAIMQLSERFIIGTENKPSALVEVSDPTRPQTDIANNITQSDNSPVTNQLSEERHCNTTNDTAIHCTEPTQNSLWQARAHNNEESGPSGRCFEAQNGDPKETIVASPSLVDSNANEMAEKAEDANEQQYITAETSYDDIEENDRASNQHYAGSNYDEIMEEEEMGDQNYDEATYEWISPISRPRSYWEERRQEWYKEMLDFGSENDERRNLLQRRTVSTFLSSDFRERIDRLMRSRGQDDEGDSEESMDQMMEFFHERLRSKSTPSEDGRDEVRAEEEEERTNEEEKVEDQEEEESITNDSDHDEPSDYSSPLMRASSSTLLRSWSYKDNEAVDDYDRVAYASAQPPTQSQSSYQDSQRYSSCTSHHSVETEFLYDMRGQMDQLFNDISELRKMIKSSIDMQMQFQQSKNQAVYSVKEEEKYHGRTPERGNCRICYEKKVAAVLYRCGHMCACLKCANELRWKGESCRICKAPIVDVVRVHDINN